MLGQLVHVVGSADGRLESGAVVPVTDNLPLTLVAAPTYTEIDALAEEAQGALRVSVSVGSASDPASYIAVVAWGAVRLRAEILLLSPTSTTSIAQVKLFCFSHTAAYLEPRANRW